MVQQLHRVVANANARPFDMRALRRLAIWGVSAAAALSVAVLAGYANPAAQRLLGTIAAAIGQIQRQAEVNPAPAATRPAEAENEIRRLAEAVRMLAADRNELLTRISSIEQSLEDITGSINRQTAAASLPLPPSPDPVAAIPEELPPTPTWVATLPAIGGSAEADLFKPKIDLRGEFGVDVGSAINFDALRVLWNSTRAGHAALLEGLSPRVTVREIGRASCRERVYGPV